MSAFAACVIVAAGKGERFGSAGKVMTEVAGRPVLAWVLDAMEAAASVRDVVIVYGPHTERDIRDLVATAEWPKARSLVPGGTQRQHSMAYGARAVPDDLEVVLVHDAARPLVEPEYIDACAETAREHGVAILAAPVSDTVKRVRDSVVVETVDRSELWGAQTPQGMRRPLMMDLCAQAESGNIEFTDEASLAEALGHKVAIVPSSRQNLKLTHPEDLILVDALLRSRKDRT